MRVLLGVLSIRRRQALEAWGARAHYTVRPSTIRDTDIQVNSGRPIVKCKISAGEEVEDHVPAVVHKPDL